MSYKTTSPQPVIEGGTGAITLTGVVIGNGASSLTGNPITQHDILVGGVSNTITSVSPSTAGLVLTSNGTSADPSFAPINGGITFIVGDSGMVSGDPIILTGGTSGAVFTGSGATITESFNYLSLLATGSTSGHIKINGSRFVLAAPGAVNATWIGTDAGSLTSSSSYQVGIGYGSLQGATGSNLQQCVAIGSSSLLAANGSSSSEMVAIGFAAGAAVGASCVGLCIIGNGAFNDVATSSSLNVAIGAFTMTGSAKSSGCTNNVCIGFASGTSITSGGNNLFVGASAGVGVATGSSNINLNAGNVGEVGNQLTIGAATGTGAGQINASFIHGIRGITTGVADAIAVLVDSAGQLGTVSSSIRYKENVQDMADVSSALLKLRPVTFDFKNKPSHKNQVGLIAEEVYGVMPDLVVHNIDGEIESIKYHEISILLLNEIKKALSRVELLENQLEKQF